MTYHTPKSNKQRKRISQILRLALKMTHVHILLISSFALIQKRN